MCLKYHDFKCWYRVRTYSSPYHFSFSPHFLGLNLCADSSLPKASPDFMNLLDGLLQKDPQKRSVWMDDIVIWMLSGICFFLSCTSGIALFLIHTEGFKLLVKKGNLSLHWGFLMMRNFKSFSLLMCSLMDFLVAPESKQLSSFHRRL